MLQLNPIVPSRRRACRLICAIALGTLLTTGGVSPPGRAATPLVVPGAAVNSPLPIRPGIPVPGQSPTPVNPTGFTAMDRGQGTVQLQWQAAPGALTYQLSGTGLPSTGYLGTSTVVSLTNVPAGPGAWQLVAIYPNNAADTSHPAQASTVVHVLPPHAISWLTMNNGAGSSAQTTDHFVKSTQGGTDPGYLPLQDGDYPGSFNQMSSDDVNAVVGISGFRNWVDSSQWANEAVYGNTLDLGVGRRSACFQQPDVHLVGITPVVGLRTACYATAHGAPPGSPGFANQDTTHPQAGTAGDFILTMLIIKNWQGTRFLVIKGHSAYPTGNTRDWFPSFQAGLDSEGGKYIPHVCLSCHGGTYNPTTHLVDGAAFLPLNPAALAFASAADLAAQQENIRRINQMIMNAEGSSAISDFIRGLYNGNVATPKAQAAPNYVPIGWAQQSGLYSQIIAPYCINCHLAGPTSYNFTSYDSFMANKAAAFVAVCKAHAMPHAEVPFRAFWTRDTGVLYLPGLFAAVLGYPSCS